MCSVHLLEPKKISSFVKAGYRKSIRDDLLQFIHDKILLDGVIILFNKNGKTKLLIFSKLGFIHFQTIGFEVLLQSNSLQPTME